MCVYCIQFLFISMLLIRFQFQLYSIKKLLHLSSTYSVVFEMQPSLFPTEQAKVAFITSHLTDRVLQKALALWDQDRLVLNSSGALMSHFWEVQHHRRGIKHKVTIPWQSTI